MMTFVITLMASLAAAVVCFEAKAWGPKLIDKLLDAAVRRVAPEIRERMREEWQSHLEETPGSVAKIAAALGFVFAAERLTSRLPLLTRAKVALVYAQLSAKLLMSELRNCARLRVDAVSLIATLQLTVFTWKLAMPTLSGKRPLSYARNTLQGLMALIEVLHNHKGDEEFLLQTARSFKVDQQTGKVSLNPSSAPQ